MNNDIKKIDTAYEPEKEIQPECCGTEDTAELEDSELVFEDDAEALERLREFESSLNGSFKRTVIISSLFLGAAALVGVILALVL